MVDHYREAERLLEQAAEVPAEGAGALIARAHVHAILALASRDEPTATALDQPRPASLGARTSAELKEAAMKEIAAKRPARDVNPYMKALQEAQKRRYGDDYDRFSTTQDMSDTPEYRAWRDEEDRRGAAVEQRRREREAAADRDQPRGV